MYITRIYGLLYANISPLAAALNIPWEIKTTFVTQHVLIEFEVVRELWKIKRDTWSWLWPSGLVISKLCNDPKFEEKLERLNAYYSKDEHEKDLFAFEKLKEILERVELRYNV